MSGKEYRHMGEDDRTALTKLVRHCGIKLLDAITLQKENFDLDQKTILFKQRKQTRTRITTIRPNDVEWFKKWLQQVPLEKLDRRVIILDRLFPFSSGTIFYHMRKITKSPHLLREELWKEMHSLGAKDSIVAVKMGHYIDVDPDEKTDLFIKLQEFEEEHFGGKN